MILLPFLPKGPRYPLLLAERLRRSLRTWSTTFSIFFFVQVAPVADSALSVPSAPKTRFQRQARPYQGWRQSALTSTIGSLSQFKSSLFNWELQDSCHYSFSFSPKKKSTVVPDSFSRDLVPWTGEYWAPTTGFPDGHLASPLLGGFGFAAATNCPYCCCLSVLSPNNPGVLKRGSCQDSENQCCCCSILTT